MRSSLLVPGRTRPGASLSRALTAVTAAALAAVVACGPGAGRDVIPTLPLDGDAHTSKPPSEAAPAAAGDPWDRKDLITAPTPPAPTR